jgi:hypothetical protein
MPLPLVPGTHISNAVTAGSRYTHIECRYRGFQLHTYRMLLPLVPVHTYIECRYRWFQVHTYRMPLPLVPGIHIYNTVTAGSRYPDIFIFYSWFQVHKYLYRLPKVPGTEMSSAITTGSRYTKILNCNL